LKHLPAAPLQLALAQVRFAPVFAIEDPARRSSFQERLGSQYQLEAREQKSDGESGGLWFFRDGERNWTVSLTPGSLGLEAKTYHDFDDFAGELGRVLRETAEIFSPQTEVRLGVRYINRIEDDRLGKRGIDFFVKSALTAPVGELGADLAYSLCELRFREQGTWLALRHGLTKKDTYLLDFDNFVEGERDFAPAEIVKRVEDYHGLIERLFAWSLSERYLKELEGHK
jgi:uncharacterized protein (TIGR04255 family)